MRCVTLLALSDSGVPVYDEQMAKKLAIWGSRASAVPGQPEDEMTSETRQDSPQARSREGTAAASRSSFAAS